MLVVTFDFWMTIDLSDLALNGPIKNNLKIKLHDEYMYHKKYRFVYKSTRRKLKGQCQYQKGQLLLNTVCESLQSLSIIQQSLQNIYHRFYCLGKLRKLRRKGFMRSGWSWAMNWICPTTTTKTKTKENKQKTHTQCKMLK